MAIQIPNLDQIQKVDPKLGEALQKEQTYINANVTQAPGNKLPPPGSFVTPHVPGG